jgi:DNA-directed RNA polymerase specialized sigma24 family protein
LPRIADRTAGRFSQGAVEATAAGTADDAWDAMMIAAQKGDTAAYRRLLLEVSSWLRQYYRRRMPPSLMDGLIEDILAALHEKRHTYQPSHPFRDWLIAIARHKASQLRRP